MTWPPAAPQWVRSALSALTLSGVPPEVMAAICQFTSSFGQPRLGINQTGFGGYFGQHVGWSYPTRPQGFTRTELLSPSMFTIEAEVAAATLASYGVPLGHALLIYSGQSTAFVHFVLTVTGAPGTLELGGKPPTMRRETMGVSISTGIVAVDGVTTTGHKFVCTVPLATRADAHKWSVMDLTDAAKLQGVATTTFSS